MFYVFEYLGKELRYNFRELFFFLFCEYIVVLSCFVKKVFLNRSFIYVGK